MECAKQGYWSFEYWEHDYVLPDTNSNRNYCNFAKRQYHKARRRHDEQVIEEQLRGRFASDNVVGYELSNWSIMDNWQEHNHKVKLREVA